MKCLSREKPKGCHHSEADPKPFVFTRHTAEKARAIKKFLKVDFLKGKNFFTALASPYTPPPF
jgi:hypothetical protein